MWVDVGVWVLHRTVGFYREARSLQCRPQKEKKVAQGRAWSVTNKEKMREEMVC